MANLRKARRAWTKLMDTGAAVLFPMMVANALDRLIETRTRRILFRIHMEVSSGWVHGRRHGRPSILLRGSCLAEAEHAVQLALVPWPSGFIIGKDAFAKATVSPLLLYVAVPAQVRLGELAGRLAAADAALHKAFLPWSGHIVLDEPIAELIARAA